MKLIPIEGNHHYYATPEGDIYSTKRGEPHKLKPGYTHGYQAVALNGKNYRAHRLIALTFIPNPEQKPCVNHLNGIRDSNAVENLEWCTHKENTQHAHRTGASGLTCAKGEDHYMHKLTIREVMEIKHMINEGHNQAALGRFYNVSQQTISSINNGRNWKHVKVEL